MGRKLQNDAVENNTIFLVEGRFYLLQQRDLLWTQKAVCWFEPVRYFHSAPASPNSFQRIGKHEEGDVTENCSLTDTEFCCQIRRRIRPPRNDHCIDRRSPFRRIQPCSLLPVRDTNSIAKIPDTFCHDSKSFQEKFTFCHIVLWHLLVRLSKQVLLQQKARCESGCSQRDSVVLVVQMTLEGSAIGIAGNDVAICIDGEAYAEGARAGD